MAEAQAAKEVAAVSQSNVTSDGTGGATDISEYDNVICVLDVTKANGTSPTLDITVQVRDVASGSWVDTTDTFTQVTGSTTDEVLDLSQANKAGRIRFSWSLGGTNPDYDFTIGIVAKHGETGASP